LKSVNEKWNECQSGVCPVCERVTSQTINAEEGQVLRYCPSCGGAWSLCEVKERFFVLKPVISIFDPCKLCGEPDPNPGNGHYIVVDPSNSFCNS